MEEKEFREKLNQIVELAKQQSMCISKQQIEEYFGDFAKDEAQQKLLLDYFRSRRISVGDKPDLDEFLSMQDRNYLDEYLAQIEAIELLGEDELSEIILSAVAGDEDAIGMVSQQYLPRVVELSKMYAGQGVLLEDLIGEGNLALFEAAMQMGCLEATENILEEAEGFLGKYMMDAMEALINEELSEKDADQKMADKINLIVDAAEELSETMRRKVTVEELADNTSYTVEEIIEAYRNSGRKIEALEVPEEE